MISGLATPASRWRKFLRALLVLAGFSTCTLLFGVWTSDSKPAAVPTSLLFANATSPLNEEAGLLYGPWSVQLPSVVNSGEAFALTLSCEVQSTPTRCVDSYYVQFYGPVAHAVPLAAFRRTSETEVEASVVLPEPGLYQVYAWPDESATCISNHGVGQAVQNTPFVLRVMGDSRTDTGAGASKTCRDLDEVLDGRWVRQRTEQRYAYKPYRCNLPHRSLLSVLPLMPDLEHLLFIGDSTARDSLCRLIYPALFAPSALGACEYNPMSKVWEHGNKRARYYDPKTGRQLEITFAFAHSSIEELFPYLDGLGAPPQAVVFNMGLWVDSLEDAEYRATQRKFFDYVDMHWSQAHVVIRSTTSVVTPVRCFQKAGHSRANSARLRGLALREAQEWSRRRYKQGHGKVGFVDAFSITDQRMETTVDGIHWMAYTSEERGWNRKSRPAVGEAEATVVDWVLDELVSGRTLE